MRRDRSSSLLLFDVGGTLLEFAIPANQLYAKALGAPVTNESVEAALGSVLDAASAAPPGPEPLQEHLNRWSHLYERIAAAAGYRGDAGVAAEKMWSVWLHGHPLYDGAREVLVALRDRGYRLGVVSNWPPTLDITLEGLGIRDLFEAVICSSVLGCRKPEPGIFHAASDALQVEAGQCVYVGDDYRVDVLGAHAAGMRPILIDRCGQAQAGIDRGGLVAFRTIKSLDELLDESWS